MIWLVVRATAAKAANGVSRSAAAVASGPRPRPRVLAGAIEAAESTGRSIRIELERVSYEVGRSLGEEVVERAGERASRAKQRGALIDTLEDHGFEPRIRDNDVVLANCPFHALARQFTDLVCDMNLRLLEGVRSALPIDEVELQPRLESEPGQCCVKFGQGGVRLAGAL